GQCPPDSVRSLRIDDSASILGALQAVEPDRAAVRHPEDLVAEVARDASAPVVGEGVVLIEAVADAAGQIGRDGARGRSAVRVPSPDTSSGGTGHAALIYVIALAGDACSVGALVLAIEMDGEVAAGGPDRNYRSPRSISSSSDHAGRETALVFDQDAVRPEINNRVGKLQRAAFDDVHVAIVISARADGACAVDHEVGAVAAGHWLRACGSRQRMGSRCAENHHEDSDGHLLQSRAN